MFLAKVRRFAACSAILTSLVAAPMVGAADDDAVASDRLLPPGVLLHVRVSDVSDLKERLPQTGFGKVYQDESMDKIRAKIEEAFDKGSEEAGKELGFPLSDLLNLPEGEVSLSLIQPAGRTLAGVLIMEIGDQKETLDKALEKLDEAITGQGATKKTETMTSKSPFMRCPSRAPIPKRTPSATSQKMASSLAVPTCRSCRTF